MRWLKETDKGCVLTVRATPRASRNAIEDEHDGALKIRLNAPPVDGKANEALLSFLKETLGCKVVLVSGEKSRIKQVLAIGLSAQQVQQAISIKK